MVLGELSVWVLDLPTVRAFAVKSEESCAPVS
jgi:hypothetical protein